MIIPLIPVNFHFQIYVKMNHVHLYLVSDFRYPQYKKYLRHSIYISAKSRTAITHSNVIKIKNYQMTTDKILIFFYILSHLFRINLILIFTYGTSKNNTSTYQTWNKVILLHFIRVMIGDNWSFLNYLSSKITFHFHSKTGWKLGYG